VRYEEIEHTADVGIRVFGSSPEELFEGAALGMFSLITDLGKVKPVGEIEIRVAGEDLPLLMVRWLSELLVIHETQNILLGKFAVRFEGRTLDGRAWGERIDKGRHELKLAIKAVTYHRLSVDATKGVAEIIFDA
jgi:SHS2 domain-containing protein